MSPTRKGFTLVELLVALVVSGLVLSLAFRAVGIAADATARVRVDQRGVLRAGAARAQLDSWLHGATLLDGSEQFLGIAGPRRDGPPLDELTFAVADAGELRPGPHRIHLWIGRDSTGLRSDLLAELVALDESARSAPETLLVAPGAAGMRVRYRGRFAGRESWAGDWGSSTQLPFGVELLLLPPGGTAHGALAPILALPLTVALRRDEGVDP
jgi:prepilin-type N-terminal cleavage/methylation domain-containing protein